MPRRPRRGAGWALALLAGLVLAAGGCGVKGPPKAPERPIIRGL